MVSHLFTFEKRQGGRLLGEGRLIGNIRYLSNVEFRHKWLFGCFHDEMHNCCPSFMCPFIDYPAFSWVRPLKPMFIYCLVMFSHSWLYIPVFCCNIYSSNHKCLFCFKNVFKLYYFRLHLCQQEIRKRSRRFVNFDWLIILVLWDIQIKL